MKNIYLISGVAESGKNYFADVATKFISESPALRHHHIQFFPFAHSVKEVAKNSFNWDGIKDEKGRALLQLIGDGGRQYDPLIWIKATLNGIDEYHDFVKRNGNGDRFDNLCYFFTDVRYPNEIKYSKMWAELKGFNCYTVRIERPNHQNKLSPLQRMNSSETALDSYTEWDNVMTNDGTEIFNELVKNYMKETLK